MSKIVILCVEDEPEVRDALLRDLKPFAEHFRIEEAEDVADAHEVMAQCEKSGDSVGLVLCDHLLPGRSGVDFLVELNNAEETKAIRKVLITGQAGLEDTVKAVNQADLHHYIAKPWTPDALLAVVREQLTEFVLAEADEVLPFVDILDGTRLLEAASHRLTDR